MYKAASFAAILLFSIIINIASVRADAICDFNGDGRSEIVLVTLNGDGHYDWLAFNPRTGATSPIINDFGNASSTLIPGNWLEADEAVAAIVSPAAPGPTGRATWSVKYLEDGEVESYTRNLGRHGDLIIQGGDYDGNGVTDSLLLKRSTGKLGLRVNYFLSSYNGNNLGTERLYRALGSPFNDQNFFFSPDGTTDYLAVLRRTGAGGKILRLKPFTDSPQVSTLGSLSAALRGPLPLKKGVGKPDLLAFYRPHGQQTRVLVKTLTGLTIFNALVQAKGTVLVGDYLSDPGWEITVGNGTNFMIVNPTTRSELAVTGPGGKVVSCVANFPVN